MGLCAVADPCLLADRLGSRELGRKKPYLG